ncbi:MAG: hypothetical protein RL013_2133 [Bacteroidota bacterium]|jgi:hypothetical protein
MKKSLLSLALLFAGFTSTLFGQAGNDRLDEIKKLSARDTVGWSFGGGIGLDMAGLGIVNPQLSSGGNRLGVGGLVNLYANNKRKKFYWNNDLSLQLSAQRLGGSSKPFQKNLDILRLGSRYGHNIALSKFFIAVDATAESQLLPTYVGNTLSGSSTDLLSDFLSPVRIAVAPGIDFKPSAKISFFFAPASWRLIYVGNEILSELEGQPLGNEAGRQSRSQLGYALKAQYTNKFFSNKVALNSRIAWFADYTNNLNGNVLWQNNLSISLLKGLSVDLFGDLFYDHFTRVVVEDIPEGTPASELDPYLGLKPTYTGGFLLKYNLVF